MAEHVFGLITDIQRPFNDYRDVAIPPEVDHLSHRLRSILDAFAAVLVHREKKEVIAIGLRLADEDTINLSIACNGTIDTKTTDHVNRVWSQLKDLAMGFQDHGVDVSVHIRD